MRKMNNELINMQNNSAGEIEISPKFGPPTTYEERKKCLDELSKTLNLEIYHF